MSLVLRFPGRLKTVGPSSRADLIPGIEREAAVVDHPVIRAIPASDTVESLVELVTACAP